MLRLGLLQGDDKDAVGSQGDWKMNQVALQIKASNGELSQCRLINSQEVTVALNTTKGVCEAGRSSLYTRGIS